MEKGGWRDGSGGTAAVRVRLSDARLSSARWFLRPGGPPGDGLWDMTPVHINDADHAASGLALKGGLLVAAALALCAAALPAFANMVDQWQTAEYSHGWIIPPLALALILHRVRQAAAPAGEGGLLAVLLTAGGALVVLLGARSGVHVATLYGVLATLAGMVWVAYGPARLALVGGPLFYLFFAVPLPQALYFDLSLDMQMAASVLGVALARLMGLSLHLDGNIIDLSGAKLEVAEACNGLRYLFPLASFGYLITLLVRASWIRRALVLLSTVPIAVLLNALRVAVTCLLVDRFGLRMAQGEMHEATGLVIFVFCIGVLLVLARRLVAQGGGGQGFLAPRDLFAPVDWRALRLPPASRGLRAACLMVIAGGLAAVVGGERQSPPPQSIPLSMFPLRLGGWVGRPTALESVFLAVLKPTDYMLIDYVEDGGQADAIAPPVDLFVAYYSRQGMGVAIHNPEQCILGSGWKLREAALVTLPGADGAASLTVNRVVIAKPGVKQVVYYWFEGRGRQETGKYAVRAHMLLDSIRIGRSDGALIRIASEVRGDEAEAAADQRLRRLLATVQPALRRYLPQ